MRIAVTGREGQIARSLQERLLGSEVQLLTIARAELDLSGSSEIIIERIKQLRPDAIISAAAYTHVDRAESEPEVASAVNEGGVRALAVAARELGVPIVHISTDYVFDGLKPEPYVEADRTGPTGVYGASKLAGEHAVAQEQSNSAILRTAWVYSPFGSNFVKTMLRLAGTRDEIGVVADQIGNPTSAFDIADAISRVTKNLIASPEPAFRGIFHMSSVGSATWAEFAEAIFACSRELGGPSSRVIRIGTADYPTPARRPANSRLDCSKLAAVHDVHLPDWHGSLKRVIGRLVEVSNLERGA